MTRYKLINGERIAFTAEEETARDAEETAAAAEKAANEYKEKREDSYPDWKTQMDMQYWDSINGTTTWKDLITKIKSDNPKPS
jgi:hypothetical protein|tara:strand:+ start:208 stop:456 length:249 start_codon:yes stop_codon:yes gene_type:complete